MYSSIRTWRLGSMWSSVGELSLHGSEYIVLNQTCSNDIFKACTCTWVSLPPPPLPSLFNQHSKCYLKKKYKISKKYRRLWGVLFFCHSVLLSLCSSVLVSLCTSMLASFCSNIEPGGFEEACQRFQWRPWSTCFLKKIHKKAKWAWKL